MPLKKILFTFGTRPEAIKLAPLIKLVQSSGFGHCVICVTGQQRSMLDQVLTLFDLTPDYRLQHVVSDHKLESSTSGILVEFGKVIDAVNPSLIVVHGDTTSTFAASLAAFYRRVPIAHIEAGLRTNDLYSPWPEEGNRRLTGVLASYHFAPNQLQRINLLKEGVPAERIFLTGNTVVDSLDLVRRRFESSTENTRRLYGLEFLDNDKKILLVTGHRRESFGAGLQNICEALVQVASRGDVQIIYPVHLNPKVYEPVRSFLSGRTNIYLTEPLAYEEFLYILSSCYFVLTDSGGVQEEAPSFGKPVLVMRDTTERIEGVDAGIARLCGTRKDTIIEAAAALLDSPSLYQSMIPVRNPYGDGKASQRILRSLMEVI